MVALKAVGLDDKLFIHKSVKFHVVDDPLVVATALVVRLGVLAYILWAIFADKAYLSLHEPTGTTVMWASPPEFPQNLTQGASAMGAGLCDGIGKYDVHYGGSWTYFNNTCREFAYGDVVQKMDQAQSIRIVTYSQQTDHRWGDCLEADGSVRPKGCKNHTSTKRNYWVPHTNVLSINIEHTYSASFSSGKTISGDNPLTFLYDNKGKRVGKFRKKERMTFSLDELLKLAGIDSLDSVNAKAVKSVVWGNPTYRMTGVVLQLDVNYDNRIRMGGSKVIAKVKVQAKSAKSGWASFGPHMHYFERDGDVRGVEFYNYGVRVVVKPTGTIGHFDFYLFLGVIAQFLVYLAVASIAADFVSNWLLGDRSIDLKYKQFDFELTHHKPETWAARKMAPTDDGAAVVGPAPPRWYWREEPGRLTAHDPALVKAPYWVAYDDEACEKLEAAYAAFAKDPGVPDIVSNVGPARDVSVKTMKQINRKTGFERDVLRE